MSAYYNEIDPFAAQWLRNLIAAGLIAPGDVDERSIVEVQPDDLRGYDQCHFFAGIGGWSHALRLAGWDDFRPAWTGSCPCQPFSAAGKGLGERDERHLWPEFRRLIAECRPATVFGEQVASRAGRDWLARVRADLEGMGYGVGAADLCAAGVGAPHIRQRLWWVADGSTDGRQQVGEDRPRRVERSGEEGRAAGLGLRGALGGLADADQGQRGRLTDGEGREHHGQAAGWQQGDGIAQPSCAASRLADADAPGQREQRRGGLLDGERPASGHDADGRGAVCGLGDTRGAGLAQRVGDRRVQRRAGRALEGQAAQLSGDASRMGDASGRGCSGERGRGQERITESSPWSNYVWLPCADGKARRIEPGLEPLVTGLPIALDGRGPISRVGALKGAGNSIVPQVAAEFIQAFEECRP